MHFLRTLFWVLVTVVVVVFTMHNWVAVTVDLFGGLEADVKLPLLLLIAFLIGFLPLYAYHRATMWRLRRATPLVTAPAAAAAPPAFEPTPPAPGSVIPPTTEPF